MNPEAFKHSEPDFSPPVQYMDNFEQELMNRIHQRRKPSVFMAARSWSSILTAACMVGLLCVAGWNLNLIMGHPNRMDSTAQQPFFHLIPDAETGILNDEELLEWIEYPTPSNNQPHKLNNNTKAAMPDVLSTDDLVDAGLIEPEDPALNLEGIF